MNVFFLLFGLVLSHPLGAGRTCIATCTGETDKWATYSPNGVTTTGSKNAIFQYVYELSISTLIF